jgi:hypothetical protein
MATKPPPEHRSATQPKGRVPLFRPAAVLVGIGLFWSFARNNDVERSSRPSNATQAVLEQLARRGLLGRVEELRWLDPPQPRRTLDWRGHRFVALLRRAGEETDVWLGRAELSPEGRLIGIAAVDNLSDTSAVGEHHLTVSKDRFAWSVLDAGQTLSIHVADLRGYDATRLAPFSRLDQLKLRLMFLQDTGQSAGIDEQVFRLDPPRPDVRLEWLADRLRVSDSRDASIITPSGAAEGTIDLRREPVEIGTPSDWITFAVDRVRALPWFGSDRMQWLKTVAFSAFDVGARVKSALVDRDGAAELRAMLGEAMTLRPTAASDPNTGWPPPTIAPILNPPLPREGAFVGLDGDPFAVPPEGGPSPFAFTFLRADPSRPHTQVMIVVMDSRRLQLHLMTGTREPKTATGETGPGKVPRTPESVGRLAAAFNGGFQATHGEYGMMADGVVYLPPKPYAATVAELSDGSVGFGTWPEADAISSDYVGFRQNLTPLLADGKDNPYRRTWWGGVPPGWEDATRTVRTGICLTSDQHIAYFYGSSIDSDHLMLAMKSARCRYGIHLDMNPGHTGLEFYRVAPEGRLPNLARKLDGAWESRGTISDMNGWEYLGRRMIRSMHLMNFPRYVRTDSRDFMYVTHRAILSKERLEGEATLPQPKGLAWQLQGLPQHGYPPAIALGQAASPQSGSPKISVMLIDAKWVEPCRTQCRTTSRVFSTRVPTSPSELRAYVHRRGFVIANQAPDDTAVLVAAGQPKNRVKAARAALGVTDGQWLYYLEATSGGNPAHDAATFDRALDEFGCRARLFLDRPLGLTIGDGEPDGADERIQWLRSETPLARRILEATPIVPYQTWAPLQAKRVRYKRQPPAARTVEVPQATDVATEPSAAVAPPVDAPKETEDSEAN